MIRTARTYVALAILGASLAFVPMGTATAQVGNETSTADMTDDTTRSGADRIGGYVFDSLILRPAGAVMLVVGSVFAIPSYPLAMSTGNQKAVLERCVLDPYDYTFTRSIGDF